jgi:hypothetical protein
MYTHPLFTQVLSDYRSELMAGESLSLSRYCHNRRVSYASLTQWMRRHGMPIHSIEIEVLLEKHRLDSNSKEALILSEEEIHALLHPTKKEKSSTSPCDVQDLLKGVSLSFPDGVTLGIRQVSPEALMRFILSYTCQSERICLP